MKWKSNFNGGYTQTFKIKIVGREKIWNETANDTTEDFVEYSITNLIPGEEYNISVMSENRRQSGENSSEFSPSVTVEMAGKNCLNDYPVFKKPRMHHLKFYLHFTEVIHKESTPQKSDIILPAGAGLGTLLLLGIIVVGLVILLRSKIGNS